MLTLALCIYHLYIVGREMHRQSKLLVFHGIHGISDDVDFVFGGGFYFDIHVN